MMQFTMTHRVLMGTAESLARGWKTPLMLTATSGVLVVMGIGLSGR